jgi:hypothetical protein
MDDRESLYRKHRRRSRTIWFSICVVAPNKPNICIVQVTAYGSCLQRIVPDIEQGACEKEFASLKVCWRAAFRASLKATQR